MELLHCWRKTMKMWTNTFKQSHPQDFYVIGVRPSIVEPKNLLISDEILSGLCYMDVLWFIVTGATFLCLRMSAFICAPVVLYQALTETSFSQIFHYVMEKQNVWQILCFEAVQEIVQFSTDNISYLSKMESFFLRCRFLHKLRTVGRLRNLPTCSWLL